MKKLTLVLALIALATLPAFAGPKAPAKAAAPKISEAAHKEAAEIFTQRCVACHGATGLGDGVAAAAMNPKPRNYGDPAWQKSVTDDYIEKVIREGGQAVGKSPLMPPNPDLVSKPEVVAALREKVRSFAKK